MRSSGTRHYGRRSPGPTTFWTPTNACCSHDSPIFAAGCTLESAEAVCGADLDVLASLLDKSLIRRRTGQLGEERFWMLETIREFASEHARRPGQRRRAGAAAREAHARDPPQRKPDRRRRRPAAEARHRALRTRRHPEGARLGAGFRSRSSASRCASRSSRTGPRPIRPRGPSGCEHLLMRAGALPPALEASRPPSLRAARSIDRESLSAARREHERSRDLFRALGDDRGSSNARGASCDQRRLLRGP